jgi:hypothetical protein
MLWHISWRRVPQGSVLWPLLCLLYTADLPTSPDFITATFVDDTAVIATDYDPATASQKLQASLLEIQSWLNTRRMKVHVTFTTRREACPPVHINYVQIAQENHVKYLGLHLDSLTWHTNIFAKREQLGLSLTKMYRLLGRKSKLSTYNSSSTKLYSNPSGLMAFNSGVQHQTQTSKF